MLFPVFTTFVMRGTTPQSTFGSNAKTKGVNHAKNSRSGVIRTPR